MWHKAASWASGGRLVLLWALGEFAHAALGLTYNNWRLVFMPFCVAEVVISRRSWLAVSGPDWVLP
jgi:hypothetical protein